MSNPEPKVLIVDDDADFVLATKNILEGKLYSVITAKNKEEALKKIEDERPDLIILDVMMKHINDGFTLCYEIKHNSEYKHIPVLMLTSVSEKTGFKFSPQTDGEYLEANEYREKPIKAGELLELVEKILNPHPIPPPQVGREEGRGE